MAHGWGRRGRARPGRPWWAEFFAESPPRAERGEIRYLVLEAIADQPRHGYEIIQHIEQRTNATYRPSPGVIYPTLQLLEELGHARVIEQEGRKVYAITDAGRADLEENRRTVGEFYERFDEEPADAYTDQFAELMRDVARLMKAFRRGARYGNLTPSAMRKIRQALDEAMRKIEDALRGP
jgi:DNA-binding PadR family transcriptional regulator